MRKKPTSLKKGRDKAPIKKRRKGLKATSVSRAPSKDLSIPIKQLQAAVSSCPIVSKENGYSFDYHFLGKCETRSCQFYSDRTDRRCLKLDVTLPSKDFTDDEIYYWKISRNPDFAQDMPKARTVNSIRKKAATAVKSNIVFYYFVSYVLETYNPEDTEFVYRKGFNSNLDLLLVSLPFKQKGIDVFKPWQLPHLFNQDVFKEFCTKQENLLIDSFDVNLNLHNVLGLTPVKFVKLQRVIQNMSSSEYQNMLSDSLL